MKYGFLFENITDEYNINIINIKKEKKNYIVNILKYEFKYNFIIYQKIFFLWYINKYYLKTKSNLKIFFSLKN